MSDMWCRCRRRLRAAFGSSALRATHCPEVRRDEGRRTNPDMSASVSRRCRSDVLDAGSLGARMSDKVGQHVQVNLSGGRLLDAEIKAIIETTDGKRLQVSFGEETARIYVWQVVEKLR